MIEILPVRLLTDEDGQLFGSLAVSLGKLQRAGLPVAPSIVVTAPNLKLKTVLEHYDFGTKEIFEQSLTLVKKELKAIPIPVILIKEVGKHRCFLFNGKVLKSVKELWHALLDNWIDEVKFRLWKEGFNKGITENLDPQVVIFLKKLEALGSGYFDCLQDDTVINVKTGKLHPNDLKKLDELIREANKKLFIPHQYEWVLDGGVKLTKVLPYTPISVIASPPWRAWQSSHSVEDSSLIARNDKVKSTVRVFLDLSTGLVVEKEADGVYITSEKIFDLNEPNESFEDLVFKLVESASSFPEAPILFKLADKSEGMGKVRGSLRLLHQRTLFDPLVEALDFARHKKGLTNIHIVIPFVRGVNELLQIKRELAVKKLVRKNSLQLWLEAAVPENIVNLEDYLIAGIDGVVLNLDELIAHLGGFDYKDEEMRFYNYEVIASFAYKNEVGGLLKFIEDGLKLLHKSKIPFIAYGTLSLYPKVLEFLVEKGVYGIVVERYEAPSAKDLLHQTERRMILRRTS